MGQHWIKKGLIFVPNQESEWMISHASVPAPIQIHENMLRIYFSSRDKKGRSIPTFMDVKIDDPQQVLYIHTQPLLPLGEIGTFDDSGIMPTSLIKINGIIFMYYIGWNPQVTVSYRTSIGLAISHDNGDSFRKYSEGPLLDRALDEPFFNTTPFVLYDNNIFKMWYASCTGWKIIDEITEPVYLIKYAESKDGISWKKEKNICINYSYEGEALGRPWIIKEDKTYKMWYSRRGSVGYRKKEGQHYRLGYAESANGTTWHRKDDEIGIDISATGWDSEMIEYCSIYRYRNIKYLFYNGNGFGKTGFGYAISKDLETPC
jgi:hypothetical protein